MAINLVKGQKIDLTKTNAGLTNLTIGLGWDPAEVTKKGLFGSKKHKVDIDCDASALLLNADGKLVKDQNLVCFYNKSSACKSVVHSGDNLTGDGDGDDEQIFVDLTKVPADVHSILTVVNIYQAEARKQDFGMVQSAYIRVLNKATNVELVRFNLSDNYAGKTALIVAEIYRHNGEWKFNAIGESAHAVHVDHLAANYR
ncbi:TerD family protein [Tumebacillus permanentifrigoris]|uniref:Stress response protein SCP2 n=1 Tax=Tumebacillus permanentifrigoris TaxID=378543 RepID=A0A316DA30_9BACL|nr:TerD family protein [Tumebacillus permanentifrigoris]PWK13094.1 stress response protein SCP2 [Tumebacillus permanentifrigoris]